MNDKIAPITPHLDWSAYENTGGFGGFGGFDPFGGDFAAPTPTPGSGFAKAVAGCLGKRNCHSQDIGVMCPSYRVTEDEKHATLHRADTLKAALEGEYGPHPFAGPELAAAMDLCVSCKGCKRECPHGVDMAQLRVETLAQRWKALGQVPLRERMFAHLPRYAHLLKHLNWVGGLRRHLPLIGKLMQRLFGIAAQRSLSHAAANDFLSAQTRPVTAAESAREVVLLVDTFTNHLDPKIAQAALEVLQAAGYTVHVARAAEGERQLCCGRTYFSHGMIGEARAEASRLLDALTPFSERGLPIIGLEPSCLLMLRDEYHALGLGERVAKLARAAVLLEEFLAREHDAKRLALPLLPLHENVLVHGHCHQKAFGAMPAMEKVLGLVPGLQVQVIESSCCGMAGSFGMEAEHYEVSIKMGELSLLPQVRAAASGTLLVANGTSCRHQIRDGAAREALHLALLLHAQLQRQP